MSQDSPLKIVISCISSSLTLILGQGSKAAMREAGKSASRKIWPELPENATPEEETQIIRDGIAGLEGLCDFVLKPEREDGVREIEFKNCGFTEVKNKQDCGELAICFFSFGLIEESLQRMNGGNKVQVKMVEKNDKFDNCRAEAIPR